MVSSGAAMGVRDAGNIAAERSGREHALSAGKLMELALMGGPAVFQSIMVLVQVNQAGYNPVRDTISSLVWGMGGWLQTANFFLVGALLVAMSNLLRTRLAGKVTELMGCLSLALMGVGFIILGIFPARAPASVQSLPAMIHGVTVYCIILLFLAACLFLARSLRNLSGSKSVFLYTVATGTLCVVFIIMGIMIMVTRTYWFGMLERVILLNGFIWLEVVTYIGLEHRAIVATRPEGLTVTLETE